ncbi:MAG: VTT domain-containing protein [Acidobacteria bacterium]|nr:VTT domain-containing protein [Acidobacteriota bacterium]
MRIGWRVGVVGLIGGLAVAVLLAGSSQAAETVSVLRGWAETRGAGGMVGFGAAYVVLALLFVPGAVLTMAAGAVYGVGWGLVVVAVATTVADAAAFLLGRHVARGAVLRLMHRYPRFRVVDRAVSRGGWRIVALVRLNPTLPYSASNYLFGVTGVPFPTFLASSAVFTLPGAWAYLYAGFLGFETLGGETRTTAEWGVLVFGLAVTVAAVAYVTVLARRALDEMDGREPAAGGSAP